MHKYKLGDKYRSDFDHDGMIARGMKANVSWGYDKLYKLHTSLEDMNYGTESKPLWEALTSLKAGNTEEAEKHLVQFHKVLKEENMESYEKGANVKGLKKYYLAWSSWFDGHKYDVKKISKALKSIGATDIHLENEGGKSNQPEVVVFSYKGTNEEPLRVIGEALETEWLYVYPVDWRVTKKGVYKLVDPEKLVPIEKNKLYVVEFSQKARLRNKGTGTDICIVKANGVVKGSRFEATCVYSESEHCKVGEFDHKWDRESFKPYEGDMKFEKGGSTPSNFDYSIGGL